MNGASTISTENQHKISLLMDMVSCSMDIAISTLEETSWNVDAALDKLLIGVQPEDISRKVGQNHGAKLSVVMNPTLQASSDEVAITIMEPMPAVRPPKLVRAASDGIVVSHHTVPKQELYRSASDPPVTSRISDHEAAEVPKRYSESKGMLSLSGAKDFIRKLKFSSKAAASATFYCNICLENCAKTLSFCAGSCAARHEYCRPCMKEYVSVQVVDGSISLSCPGMGSCSGVLDDMEIQSLCEEDVWSRYLRFKAIKTNPNYRECPSCGEGATVVDPPANPVVSCGKCQTVYCFFHANAHPGLSCEEYARRLSRKTRADLVASEELVTRSTRQCPRCGAPTEKNGGCNHMTCQSCHANWCWLCNSIMDDVTEHYQSVFGCPGMQFTDEPAIVAAVANRCSALTHCCHCCRTLFFPLRILDFLIGKAVCGTVALVAALLGVGGALAGLCVGLPLALIPAVVILASGKWNEWSECAFIIGLGPGYLLGGLLGGGFTFTLDFVWLTVVAAVSCALCLPCLCRGEDTDGDGNCIEDFLKMVLYRSIIIGITNLLPDSS